MPTYGYARVSTAEQATNGESLTQQEAELHATAMKRGTPLDAVYVDRGVSASTPLKKRPEGSALLKVLKKGDVVIACKLDRMFRSSLDAEQTFSDLAENGILLILLDLPLSDGPFADFMRSILAAFAQFERALIRQRVATVKRTQKDQGRYLGGIVPFGYTVEGEQLVAIPERLQALEEAKARVANGERITAVAASLGVSRGGLTNMLRGRKKKR